MSSSSQSSASPPSALEGNGVATTKVSSGHEYVKYAAEVLDPPSPLPNLSQYDQERIKLGLTYANLTSQNQNRKLSPLGTRALMLYRDACACFLEEEGGEVFDEDEKIVQTIRKESIVMIQAYEHLATLQTTRSVDAQILQDNILNLHRASFHARYGEIWVTVCRRLGNEAEACKFASWQTSENDYWTDVSRKLEDKNEKAAYDLVLKGAFVFEKCPTYTTIMQSCIRVGLQMKEILAIIQDSAFPYEFPHASLLPLIKRGRYQDLMKRLNDDFCNIPLIIPAEEVFQTSLMVLILEAMINLWFCRDENEPDDILKWTPSKELRRYHWELKGLHPRSGGVEINQEMSDTIMLSIWKRCHDQQKKQKIISTRENDFGLATEGRKRKRVASYQLAVEIVQRMQNWSKLMSLICEPQTRTMSDVYAGACGYASTCIICGSHPIVLPIEEIEI